MPSGADGSAACFAWTARAAGLGPAYLVALGGALAVLVTGSVRYVRAPSARTANLRPAVEAFAVVASLGLVLALALARGVTILR